MCMLCKCYKRRVQLSRNRRHQVEYAGIKMSYHNPLIEDVASSSDIGSDYSLPFANLGEVFDTLKSDHDLNRQRQRELENRIDKIHQQTRKEENGTQSKACDTIVYVAMKSPTRDSIDEPCTSSNSNTNESNTVIDQSSGEPETSV